MSATRRTMLVGMASKRALLELLSRDELLAAVDLFGVEVPDRRAKDGIVDALVASRKVSLAQALADFPRDRLKDLCRSLGLDDAGREKTALIDRLTGASAAAVAPGGAASATAGNGNGARTTAAGNGNGAATAQPRTNGKQAAAAPPTGKLTREQLEGYLWSAADILRGSIDSSDYKNYILGLLFLKRLSDRFAEECEAQVNHPEAVRKLIEKLGGGRNLKVCYEAGPTGYALYWQLTKLGVDCEVSRLRRRGKRQRRSS